jgi:hypothetical protein
VRAQTESDPADDLTDKKAKKEDKRSRQEKLDV